MKLNYYIICLLLAIGSASVWGQEKSYTLSQPDNVSKNYVARDFIRLLPGYSFNSAGGKTLNLSIDEHLLFPAVYQSASNPNRSINTSYAVGTIAGDASVTPTGAAIYQIPIEVMPGTGGMQPNISIVYNSQSGNGLVGYGWSLGAVSAITRVGKTIYHDGSVGVPDLTTSDNLMLDGQRLIRASGTNLTVSSTYKTEIESFLEITCKSINSYLGFEVKNKEGWTMEYGSSADSYVKPKNGSVAYAWLLKKVTDANGNYMTYTYENTSTTGEFRLKQIDYTGNSAAGLNSYNKIEFFYETRADNSASYIDGKLVAQSVILKRIKCSAYDSTIREYKFNYYYDGFYSKLTEVEEYGQEGLRYNSTIVDWGDYSSIYAKTGSEYQSNLSINREGKFPLYADFNGDGKTDFISYPEKTSYTTSDVATLFLANNSSNGVQFVKQCTIPLVAGFEGLLPVDLNGDGLMDIVRIHKDGKEYHYYYCIFNGTSFSVPASYSFKSSSKDVLVGDFNGDGKHEILAKSENKLYNQSGEPGTAVTGVAWGKTYYDALPIDRNLIDFNGNGKTNLLILDDSEFRIYELNGSSFSLLTSGTDLKNNIAYGFLLGDFNGDGKTDIWVNKSTTNEYYILFSTGTGFEKKILPNLNIPGHLFTCDFNRDGKTDIAYGTGYNGSGFTLKVGLFDGVTFQFENHTSSLVNMVQDWRYLHFSDFDGDGFPELCFAKSNNEFIIKSFDSKQNLFVNKIINGLNQTISFDYNPITDDICYGTNTASYTFPLCKFRQPLYVVSSMTRKLGNISSDTESFYYRGARIHKQGKGFLGFEEVCITNFCKNRKTTTQYGYNSTYFNVYPTKQTVITPSGRYSILQTDFVNNYYTTSVSKVIFPYVSKQTTVDELTGITKNIEYAYTSADHGNPNKITETQGSLITETIYTWSAKNSSFKNRVTQQVTNRKGIGATFSETKKFDYDAKARPTQKIDYFGHAKAVTTTYSNYDNFGNPRTVTTTAAYCPTVTVSSVYDATGRFVVSYTDELSNISSAQYDPKTGISLEQTDILGLKTTCQYDGFQRLMQKVTPVDRITYSINWDISGDNLFKTAVQSQISGTQTTWYNTAGLETKMQKPGNPGYSSMIVSEKSYNTSGQLYRSYLPGYGSKSSQYVEYQFDDVRRLKKEISLGLTTTYGYNGLTDSITTPDGQKTFRTLNLSGLVASSTDAAGNSVTYTYNSLGKPETVSSNGITTTIKYDNRGFQQVLKDANLTDSIKYEYNAYGQLTSQTNARKLTTSFQYDAAGRIIAEISLGRTLTYQYVSSGNGIGQIQTIKQNGNIVRSYTYTSLGQVASLTEKIDNVDYTTSYIYNPYGQVIEQQSPSGMKVSYQYNNNGMLTSMRNGENNNLLWELNAANALGQITESTQGNGLKRFSGYDSYNLPNQILLKNGISVIDQVNYSFNPTTGNLINRNDVSNSKSETFGYDNLNRLTGISLNGSTTANAISYYANGNINTKFDVGTYQYDNSNHAVSGITGKVSSYNPSALDISYNVQNRVSTLTQPGSTVKKLEFLYNTDNQRNKTMYYENNVLNKTMYYVGNYEKEVISGGSTKEYDYIYTPEGLSAIAIKTNGTCSLYYVNTDHLGSIRVVTKADKSIQAEYYYDAWGKQTVALGTSITNRGYTGHEHLNEFGLINMNARLYDPVLGRFMGMDPYVQMPDFTQSHNRYSYCLNNPLIYTDPDGEFIFSLFLGPIGVVLDAMCWGAVIGAGTGAVAYTVGAGISGNWSWSGFGNAIGMGAVGGAVGAGFGALGGALGSFGNSLGYNILSQASSNALTNTIFGNDLTWGSVAGSLIGGLVGSGLPNFNAVSGGAFKNAMAEIGFNSAQGAFTGFFSGMTQAAIDKNPDAIWQNTLGGAISGASTSILNIATFGAAVNFDDSYIGHPAGEGPIYRKGGIASLFNGQGINWGRTAWVNGRLNKGEFLEAGFLHEGTHWWQQKLDGFGTFYGKTAKNYTQSRILHGTTWALYTGTYKPLNYEHMAQTIQYLYLNSKGYNFPISF
ncbi:MAG: FG-GAP-like repeat-containing protein [Dysgonamonadaceae bacterium]|jgi:RHS repeat-associated protein|nr:FG-GAP-like repeat-containing protein [Dysgonamonadaceae bacterium]